MDITQLGARIRELREISGFTPAELAARLSVPEEKYIEYERSGQDIPISALHHLAMLYRVDMTELLTGVAAHLDTVFVTRGGQGQSVDRYPGYRFASLAHNFKRRIMEPLLVTVEPEDCDPTLVSHGGQEFNYVLSGALELLYGERRFLLHAGDCAYFDPRRPHGQRASGGPAVFITVIAEETSVC